MFLDNRQLQKQIEEKFSSKKIWKMVKDSLDPEHTVLLKMQCLIETYLTKEEYYKSKQIRIDSLCSLPIQDIAETVCAAVLQASSVSPIQAICTKISHHLGFKNILDGIKTGAELLAVCEPAGLYKILRASNPDNITDTLEIVSNYSLPTAIQAKIDRTKYLPPMVCKPNTWNSNRGGGSLTSTHDSIILGHINHHEQYQNLQAINILQDISWSLNYVVEYEEQPNSPIDTWAKQKQFNLMVKQSNEVYSDLMEQGNRFHFVWKYDKRGRMYSQGYHCNLQGTQYKKSIIEFTKEELIT